mgnify:CR=1 FL=1
MIQKSFFLLLLTLSLGLNSALPSNKLHSFSLAFLHDENANLSIDEVVNEKFTLIPSQNSLSNHYNTVWYKVTMPSSPKHSQLYLHNKLAYLSDRIDIYELTGKTIVKNNFDLLGSNVANKMTGSTLIYPFSKPPNKTKTIFIKNKGLIHQIIDIEIYDKKQSVQALINKNYFSNFIISCLFALALYNAMIFFYNKRKEFLIYAIYLMNAAIGLSYLYGTVFHNFNIYGSEVYWLNITAILVPLFLALYVQFVFETHKTSKNVHWVFNGVIVLAAIYVAIAIFISVPLAIDLLGILYIASFSAICFFVIHFFKKKHALIKVFSIAYFVYVFGMSITLCTLMGYMPYNGFTFSASGLGILIEAVLFSYLLNFRMIQLEKEAEREKVRGQEQNQFLAMMTHEIRTPIAVIDAANESLRMLAENDKNDGEQKQRRFDRISRSVNRLNTMLEMALINTEHESWPFELRSVSVVDLSRDILEMLDSNDEQRVSLQNNEQVLSVTADRRMLRIAMLNIIDNALKYTLSSSLITIQMYRSTDQNKEGVWWLVVDKGVGIPEGIMGKVFDKYERGDEPSTQAGLGLGLYLVKNVIERHQGQVIIENMTEGGAKIGFWLPS